MEVPKELKNEIWEYCRANDITNIEEFMLNMLRRGFNIEKYGEKPPFAEEKQEEEGRTEERELSDEELRKEEENRKKMEEKMEEMEEEIKRLKDKSGESDNKERDIYGEHGSNLLD